MYSDIIAPEVYNRLMSVHAYIPSSDCAIASVVRKYCASISHPRIIEVGCGPGRITGMLARAAPSAEVVGIDHDTRFVAYAQQCVRGVAIVHSDVMHYTPHAPVDVVVSQGFHHHVPKSQVGELLKRICAWLAPTGIYVLGDEFLADYATENERRVRCVSWYAHIIASALKRGEQLLAREEAKTLLDDVQVRHKSERDIALVFESCAQIDREWRVGIETNAQQLLAELDVREGGQVSSDRTLDLSRGDYKVDHAHFITEVTSAGFRVASVQTFGPQLLCGSLAVFVLQK